MIRFDVKVPDYAFELTNELECVQAAGDALAKRITERLQAGKGARGELPAPKDGGKPAQRTGLLLSSVDVVIRWKSKAGGSWTAVVTPTGDRPDAEVKRNLAAARTEEKRAALAFALTFQYAAGTIDKKHLRKKPTKSGEVLKKIRVRKERGAGTNAAVAAILSQPPRDARSRAGGRKQYRIFERSPEYDALVRLVLSQVARVEVR